MFAEKKIKSEKRKLKANDKEEKPVAEGKFCFFPFFFKIQKCSEDPEFTYYFIIYNALDIIPALDIVIRLFYL